MEFKFRKHQDIRKTPIIDSSSIVGVYVVITIPMFFSDSLSYPLFSFDRNRPRRQLFGLSCSINLLNSKLLYRIGLIIHHLSCKKLIPFRTRDEFEIFTVRIKDIVSISWIRSTKGCFSNRFYLSAKFSF